MTLDEEDDFIQQIMANCDTAVAAAAASMTWILSDPAGE
jgi:hypothetical protein